jgi:nucleoside-diphosphate-sugar epimerase
VNTICDVFEYSGNIKYDASFSDGQRKKTTNDDELQKYLGGFKFTSLYDGISSTIEFFKENYNTVRK